MKLGNISYITCAPTFDMEKKQKRGKFLKVRTPCRAGGVIGDEMKIKLQKINLIVLALQQRWLLDINLIHVMFNLCSWYGVNVERDVFYFLYFNLYPYLETKV